MPEEMIKHLINIVDMYLDEEEKHYEEAVETAKMHGLTAHVERYHIFHDLLAISHWIKENHTMIDIDEDVSAEIQMAKERWNEKR